MRFKLGTPAIAHMKFNYTVFRRNSKREKTPLSFFFLTLEVPLNAESGYLNSDFREIKQLILSDFSGFNSRL